jgi:hypothetical protein
VYIGILHFFGQREWRGALISFLAVYILVDIYYTYFNNDIVIRRVVLYLTIAALMFVASRAAYIYKIRALTA